jgi:hypothetical protein
MKSFYEFYLQIQREAATTTNYSSSIVTGNPTNNQDMQRKLDIMKRMEDPNWDPNKEAQIKAAQSQRQAPAAPAVDDNKIRETAKTINTLLTRNKFAPDVTYSMMNPEMKKILLNDTNFQKIKNLFTRNKLPTIAIDKLSQIAKKDNTLTTTPTTPAAPAQTAQTGMNAQKTLSAKTPKEFWDALGPKMQQSIVDNSKSGRLQVMEKTWTDAYAKYPNAVVVLKQMLAAVARKYPPAINTSTQANASSTQPTTTQPTTTQLTTGQEARAQAARESAARTQNVKETLAAKRNQAIIPTPSKPRNSVVDTAVRMLGYGTRK